MKTLVLILVYFIVNVHAFPQANIQKTIEVKKGQKVELLINDANLINIRGWNENYMEITVLVQINNGRNNDSFQLEVNEKTSTMYIEGSIQDKDKLPRMIRIHKDDQVYSFNTDDDKSPEIMKFYEVHGREGIQWTSHGVMWDIKYEIKIPNDIDLKVNSKFAMIDIDNFEGNIQANSKHGGVDFEVESTRRMDFNLKSDWGEIFTNLNLKFDSEHNQDDQEVTCSLNGGGGLLAVLESKHGNIYLRDAK